MLKSHPSLHLKVSLVDSDLTRRGRISYRLTADGLHVEPFESGAELALRPPAAGVILVHDEAPLVDRALILARRFGSSLPVVVYGEAPVSEIVATVRRGAADYVCWGGEPGELIAPLHAAASSGPSLRLVARDGRLERLTRREHEVLEAAAGGLSSRLTGERLAISPRTVEVHRANVLKKMGVREMAEAIRIRMELS